MSEEPEVVDLGAYLSVLDRNQLEHLVVKMIMKDESNFDDLVEAAGFFDEASLLEDVDKLQEEFSEKPEVFIKNAKAMVARATTYGNMKNYGPAIKILYSLTNFFVMQLIEGENTDAYERATIDEMIATLENTWKAILASYVPPAVSVEAQKENATKKAKKDTDEDEDEEYDGPLIDAPVSYEEVFNTLAQWRVQLQEKFGPLFSDPLRVLKATMVKQNKTKAPTQAGNVAKKQKK